METTKTRTNSLEVSQRTSSLATPRTSRKLKISDCDPVSSPNLTSRAPKLRNLKANERRSMQSSATEKKCSGKVSELEAQIVELQEELKKAKEQLMSSESMKKRAQEEEEARLQELRKISQERDRAWQSELEAVQKQHELDSAEIQKLKIEGRNAESAHADQIQHLRFELSETLALVEDLKSQLNHAKRAESEGRQELKNSQMQLEVARMTEETLRSDVVKAKEACKCMALELQQSKNPEAEINKLKAEVTQLRAALEGSERRYQEEYIQTTLQIRSAYELMERTKSESLQLEAKLKALEKENVKEAEKSESELESELKKTESVLADLKACFLDKETELQCLKSEIQEREAKNRLGEDDEQLNAAQAANTELEEELRRLKVQANQWRKAAEAAAAMLSTTANNGKYCMDFHTLGGKLGSTFSDDTEDDSPKKKNGNMLRKIGVLLKKSQK